MFVQVIEKMLPTGNKEAMAARPEVTSIRLIHSDSDLLTGAGRAALCSFPALSMAPRRESLLWKESLFSMDTIYDLPRGLVGLLHFFGCQLTL